MQRIGLLGLTMASVSMVLSMGVARADESQYDKRGTEFEVSCRFSGGAKKGTDTCLARATIFSKKDHRPETELEDDVMFLDEQDSEGKRRNKLAVACNGELVFKGAAKFEHDGGHATIEGIENHKFPNPPVITLSKPEEGSSRRKLVVSSWLDVDGAQLQGFCEIRKKKKQEASDDLILE